MADPDGLEGDLRSLAARLEQASRPVDPNSVVDRAAHASSRSWRPLAAVSAVVLLVAGAVVVERAAEDRGGVDVTAGSTTTASPPDGPSATYRGMPFGELPTEGIAIGDGTALTLLAFDGSELGVAEGHVAGQMGSAPVRLTVVVRPNEVVELVDADPAEEPDGCGEAAGAGGLRVALCGGGPQARSRIVTVTPTGQRVALIGEAPGSDGAGHWRWAIPSPDGRWVLAQWSGECEVPTAFLLGAGGRAVGTVDGRPALPGAESIGLGWSPDGRAVVQFGAGVCGGAIGTPGIHLVDPESGDRTLVRAGATTPTTASLWRRQVFGSEAEVVAGRVIDELALERCCGEPSHGGAGVATGVRWQGFEIPIGAVPAQEPPHVPYYDSVLDAAAAEVAGAPVVVGEADGGRFLAFTCGGRVWSVGGTGTAGARATADAVRSLAEAVLPRLYCTVGPRPDASGHHEGP